MKNRYINLSVLLGCTAFSSNLVASEIYLACDKNDALVVYDKTNNVAKYQINNKFLIS
nr:hypothetical protein GTC16762_13930 [Pigmentibacter ruber]